MNLRWTGSFKLINVSYILFLINLRAFSKIFWGQQNIKIAVFWFRDAAARSFFLGGGAVTVFCICFN